MAFRHKGQILSPDWQSYIFKISPKLDNQAIVIMKKLFYRMFKPLIFRRSMAIKTKQSNRFRKVKEAHDYMVKWSDMPMRELVPGICRDLGIVNNKAAEDFIWRLALPNSNEDLSRLAKKIPLK